MEKKLLEEAFKLALKVRENAYAPYSNFKVGAVLVTKEGKMFAGCNVENVSYGLTICAERVAVFKAVSEGGREFSFMVVVTDTDPPAAPCGACRQVIREFGLNIDIVAANIKGDMITKPLSEFLPDSFGPEDLT